MRNKFEAVSVLYLFLDTKSSDAKIRIVRKSHGSLLSGFARASKVAVCVGRAKRRCPPALCGDLTLRTGRLIPSTSLLGREFPQKNHSKSSSYGEMTRMHVPPDRVLCARPAITVFQNSKPANCGGR